MSTTVRYAKPRGIRNVPENLPEPLKDLLEQLRGVALATVIGDIARAQVADGTIPTSSGASGGDADLTPPPTPAGVTVVAGPDFVGIVTSAPTFTAGNGYGRTIVYGAKYPGTGPLPTFASAAVVHEFVGQVGTFPTEPGTQWHIWTAWRSLDGVTSTAEGGVNGHQVTTGQDMSSVATALNGIVTPWLAASKILAGSLAVGEYIQSSAYTPGGSGFRIDGAGGVDIANVGRTRVLNLGATGTQPVLKAGSAFEILANGNATFSGTLTASNFYSSTSGKRIVINDANDNEMKFYDASNVLVSSIGINTLGGDIVVGLFGTTTGTNRIGVYGRSNSNRGVWGEAVSGFGVDAQSVSGVGARGASTSNFGVQGVSSTSTGVSGTTSGIVAGVAGVYGLSNFGAVPGVQGEATATGDGVKGSAASGAGLLGVSTSGNGISASSSSGHGASFTGNGTKSALHLEPVSALPSSATTGDVIVYTVAGLGPTLCWYSSTGPSGAGWYRPDAISLA